MKIQHILSASILAISATAFAAGDHANETKPHHGGVVSVVKDVSYELVTSGDTIRIHVRDHGKTPDLSGATAKLTLLSGTKKQEVALTPDGSALSARGSFAVEPGTKAVAQVSLEGKSTQSVRFSLK